MEINKKNQPSQIRLERIIGIVFLIPPIIGVISFVLNLLSINPGIVPEMKNLSSVWTGIYQGNLVHSPSGAVTSAVPIYLGLMAIAGSLLLKGTDNKEN